MVKVLDYFHKQKFINLLQVFSIPLIFGIIIAIFWANLDGKSYHVFIEHPLLPFTIFGHEVNFHFLINDIFMVFFFGIATVEIVKSILPGGSLNPVNKAFNPLFGALGGIVFPIFLFFVFCYSFPLDHILKDPNITEGMIYKGWGIPTATDIALAWLVSRFLFGYHHPAVSYLLVLAIVDDAIGLGIIAIFYPDPNHPVEPIYLLITLLGMGFAFLLRIFKIKIMLLYLILGGVFSWVGLLKAHLHPALTLVFIIPFMPSGTKKQENVNSKSTLDSYEHHFKLLVDFGLLGFGLANAGVAFSKINEITWIILSSLILGKIMGIYLFGVFAHLIGMKLPKKIDFKSLFVIGSIGGLGLTVALFVSGEAYTNKILQEPAKMGAFFSIIAAVIAFILAKMFKIKKEK